MESDERFKHLASDPRFKTLRKKQKKVNIDDRFQSMFTDKKFTLKYSIDKRGRNQKKTSGEDLKKYYHLETEARGRKPNTREEEEEDKVEPPVEEEPSESESAKDLGDDDDTEEDSEGKEYEDVEPESGEENDEENSEDDATAESELSSSSDESESEIDEPLASGDEDFDLTKVNYNWKPLDHDAETAETSTRRLAIQNLDWDNLDVRDIYTLVNSIRPPLNVRIYVSEFGKERLAKEEIEGPQEIVEMSNDDQIEQEYNELREKMETLKNKNAPRINEYVDADEEMNPKDEEVRERIRRYQLNRMRYYYAIAEFDSAESAEAVYKELDGMEYEGSSLELDLRFVPDEMEFDDADMKAECNKAPDLATYKAPLFINSALQQTTVKFTWDATDTKRQDKLRRAFTKDEIERDDLEVYLASESDSDEDEELAEGDEDNPFGADAISTTTANSEARALKYRNLLKSLEEAEEKKKKVDVDVEWGNYSDDEAKVDQGDEDGERDDGEFSEDEREADEDDEFPDDDEPVSESDEDDLLTKSKSRGKTAKVPRGSKKSKRAKRGKKGEEAVAERDEELELMVMDVNREDKEGFQFNPEDNRFQAVYESGLYNIDPSHPNFKRTEAFDKMAERKRQRRLGSRAANQSK